MTLFELTGQESGIVIYTNGDTIVCNWSLDCPQENDLPKLFFGGVVGWDAQEIVLEQTYKVKDWMDEFRKLDKERGITVLYDANGDLICPESDPAHIYRLDDGTIIIAPDYWN